MFFATKMNEAGGEYPLRALSDKNSFCNSLAVLYATENPGYLSLFSSLDHSTIVSLFTPILRANFENVGRSLHLYPYSTKCSVVPLLFVTVRSLLINCSDFSVEKNDIIKSQIFLLYFEGRPFFLGFFL